jgi:hypothetical protein
MLPCDCFNKPKNGIVLRSMFDPKAIAGAQSATFNQRKGQSVVNGNRDSSVDIATTLPSGGPEFESWQGLLIYLLSKMSIPDLMPPSLLFNGYRRSFPWHDVGHSLSSSVEVKNEWSYTSAFSVCLHGVDRGNCALMVNKCPPLRMQYLY